MFYGPQNTLPHCRGYRRNCLTAGHFGTSGLSNSTLLICRILVFRQADVSLFCLAKQGCGHEEGVYRSID